jgi:hypothetical protein
MVVLIPCSIEQLRMSKRQRMSKNFPTSGEICEQAIKKFRQKIFVQPKEDQEHQRNLCAASLCSIELLN